MKNIIKKDTGNFQSVQFLRGIAALLVVLSHIVGGNYLSHANPFKLMFERGWMGVEIFFIISGFIIPYAMYKAGYKLTDFKIFFLKRVVRIEPPYIISIVLVLLLNWAGYLHSSGNVVYHPDWRNVWGHIGYLNAFTGQPWLNQAYWTLAIEFEYYILLALLFPLIAHRNALISLAVYFLLLACTFLQIPLTDKHIPEYLPFFLIGISLCLYRCERVSAPVFFLMLVSALAVCFVVHGPLFVVVSISAVLGIYYIKRVPAVLLFPGTISYSLYLIHNVLITRFMSLSAKFFPGVPIVVHLLLCIAFCIGAAYLFYLVIEKPFHKLSKKISYKKPVLS